MLPVVAMLMPESPSDIGLAPYGASTLYSPPQRDNPFAVAMAALSRAARSIGFWLLTLIFGICGFSISTAAVARPQKHPDDRASAAFRIRLTSAERALLDEKAAAAGVTLSQLIRSAVLGHQLPSPPIVREAMSELHRVGVNLNQLTRPCQHDRRHARPRRAARHPGRARSRRALRPRSMIPRGGRGHGFHVDAAFVLQ
jgi:hypothetical protein